VSASSVLTGLCTYFGGAFDPSTRTYRTPQIAGLGTTRHGFVKLVDEADFYLGMAPGTATGSQLIVYLTNSTEKRIANPAVLGWKEVRWSVELWFFCLSKQRYAEDASLDVYALRDAAIARIHADPTCGSGGYEVGKFQIGEGAPLETVIAQGDARKQIIEATVLIKAIAIENVQA
jgi:hypothetical protein